MVSSNSQVINGTINRINALIQDAADDHFKKILEECESLEIEFLAGNGIDSCIVEWAYCGQLVSLMALNELQLARSLVMVKRADRLCVDR